MKSVRELGIFSWYGFNTPIIKRLKKIKESGFDSTMLWWGDELSFKELNKQELIKETHKNKLIIENIHVPFDNANDIWSADNEKRDTILKNYKEWIRDCSTYGIPTMVMHISKGNEISNPNKYGYQSIEILTNEAEKCNINITLENTRKNNLLEYLLDSIESPNLGICYDTSHAQLYGDEKFNLLKKYNNRIFCFHISDNDGLEDKHWPVGAGVIDWQSFVSNFPLDYKGIISLEVYPRDTVISEENFLNEAYESIKSIEMKISSRK